MQAYIDESGGKGQSVSLVLAGWIATAEAWARFSDQWDTCLRREPRIGYFKMDEAAVCGGQFRGIGPVARDDKVRSLARIIAQHAMVAFHVTTDIAAYVEVFAGRRPFRDPYFWPFHAMIMGIAFDLIERGVQERFEVIFDEHSIFGPRAKSYYPWVRDTFGTAEVRDILPVEPMFKRDDEFLPLQAADMIAWLLRRSIDGHRNDFEWVVAEELSKVSMSSKAQFFTRERMEHIMTKSRARKPRPEEVEAYRAFLKTLR